MPRIHLPTLLLVVGVVSLGLAFLIAFLTQDKTGGRTQPRPAQPRRPVPTRPATTTRVTTPPTRRSANAAERTASGNQRADGSESPEPSGTPAHQAAPETLHSDNKDAVEARQLAELLAEEAPERIVAILRRWLREDDERQR